MKWGKHKVDKDELAIRLRIEAGVLRQGNKSEYVVRIADLLDAAAQRIEDLETRLRRSPA